eukprot:gene14505-biopygen10463
MHNSCDALEEQVEGDEKGKKGLEEQEEEGYLNRDKVNATSLGEFQ